MRVAVLVVVALLVAGCGGTDVASTTTATRAAQRHVVPATALRVASVGNVALPDNVRRVALPDAQLVFVDGGERVPADVPAGAHVVLVGRSHESAPDRNVSGILFRDDESAYLAGVVASLVVADEGALDSTVAWVGTKREDVVSAFARGARSLPQKPTVLRSYVEPDATRCKEAALDAIGRGAGVIFAGRGPCALGARAAAKEQNALGLSLSDFEDPQVAVAKTVADAESGLFHEREDVVFGAASGAVDVGDLGARVSPETIVKARQVAQELASGLRSPG